MYLYLGLYSPPLSQRRVCYDSDFTPPGAKKFDVFLFWFVRHVFRFVNAISSLCCLSLETVLMLLDRDVYSCDHAFSFASASLDGVIRKCRI